MTYHRIVILESLGFTDAQLQMIASLGELTNHQTPPASEDELIARLQGHTIAISGWCHYPARVLEAAPNLACIALCSAGSDYVDLAAAAARPVTVLTTAGYGAVAVGEFTVSIMLNVLRRVHEAANALAQGNNDWRQFQGHDLRGKTVGVIGAGAIGRHVMHLLQAFGANILCHTRRPEQVPAGVTLIDLDTLLRSSDIVTLHLPLTGESEQLLNRTRLSSMKRGSLLINTARGNIVDEAALLELLQSGHLGGAALDVFCEEPAKPNPAWFAQKNVLLTPHIAFNSTEAFDHKMDVCVANVVKFCGK